MKCPKCSSEENLKWFLRHQKEDENDEGTNANVITVLCTECGNNESVFIENFLPLLFKNWDEKTQEILKRLQNEDSLIISDSQEAEEVELEE